ncbi:ATP-binding protein [Anabaena cylindrica UHCC 0172]|uniref:ATP-binding protein n=1 Tax=Anabaena cylindrica TaxID=1165 RepID=UPI002B214971|nr:ATP-binding protein [Anabaena cylindrica]MEA5554411.1 ATP-binding protein [Anabaena cylindrica UHCC 0172]
MAGTLRASKQGLELIDQVRRARGWSAQSSTWAEASQVSLSTLKRFLRKTPIAKHSFVAICQAVGIENWEEIADLPLLSNFNSEIISPVTPSFFSYDPNWVGRDSLLTNLQKRVESSCRLLILTGIGGIGKTALAERLAVELQSNWLGGDWSKFIQENFDDQEQPTDFDAVASRLLEKCGQAVTPEESKDSQRLLHRFVKHLEENRYLLVIDSLENILKGNEDQGWSEFADARFVQLFSRILSATSFQSLIILTSQDIPAQILELGTRYQNFWYSQQLTGLSNQEQLALFDKTGLGNKLEASSIPYLARIGAAYEGHPLALRIIIGEIKGSPFNGNVIAYWNKYGSEIEEVEKVIFEAQKGKITGEDQWKLDRFTLSLQRNVRLRLKKSFARLEKNNKYSYILLCETSVYRCPVPEAFWLSHLEDWDCNREDQIAALEALKERYLVEEIIDNNQYLLRQHNLIRSVSLEHLTDFSKDSE